MLRIITPLCLLGLTALALWGVINTAFALSSLVITNGTIMHLGPVHAVFDQNTVFVWW